MLPLKWSAFLYAVLWTAGMIWWDAPLDAVKIVIWGIAGALNGLLWYWLMSLWLRRQGRS